MTGETRITELDDHFENIYAAARSRLLDEQKAHALILIDEDQLLLYHGGGDPEVLKGLRPPLYNKLKTLGHIPLAIFCLLVGETDEGNALPQPVLSALQDYQEHILTVRADLATAKELEAGILPRKVNLLERALSFLDRVIANGRVSEADLTEYSRYNVDDLNVIFAAATRAQLDVCHAHMMHLKENVLSADDWASLRVVIMGPHMAHRDQNFLQYFSRLLHTPMYAGKRVVYYEGEDIDGALNLIGTHILDFRASRSIFHDETRLHRDVLADATAPYLDKLLPQTKAS